MISTTAIAASDFYETGDSKESRSEWKAGALRHVVAALAGTSVVLITDKQTGHAVIGAKLIGLSSAMGGGDTLVYELGDGMRSAVLVFKIGAVIVPLEQPQAKWDALERFREESSVAQAVYRARVGTLENVSSARTSSLAHGVHVSRYVRREYSNGKGTYETMEDWGSVSVAEIRAAADCGDCLHARGRHAASCSA